MNLCKMWFSPAFIIWNIFSIYSYRSQQAISYRIVNENTLHNSAEGLKAESLHEPIGLIISTVHSGIYMIGSYQVISNIVIRSQNQYHLNIWISLRWFLNLRKKCRSESDATTCFNVNLYHNQLTVGCRLLSPAK